MSAGMISVPAIIPLKPPGLGATGSRKWSVNTNTLIEMQTNTKGCVIFYTLNGSKPDPFKKIGDKTTYHYSKPITLRPGKRTLKAIAVLKDGTRESSVNTKVFQVTAANEVVIEDEKKSVLNTTWKSQFSDDEENDIYDEKMFKKIAKSGKEKTPDSKDPVRKVLTDSFFENHPVIEEYYFSCAQCDSPRPSDPYARFCNQCNAILPPAPGKMRSPNTYSTPTKMAEVYTKLSERVSCKNCGTNNPNNVFECLVCDEPLGNSVSKLKKKPSSEVSKAPQPSNDFIVCPYCTRINSADARFCDWCGEKSSSTSRMINCRRCSTENVVSAKYCCSCGKLLEAPPRKSFEDMMLNDNVKIEEKDSPSKMELLSKLTEGDGTPWNSIEFEPVALKETKNVSIQVGDSMMPNIGKSNKLNNKASPGKGYWRQQLDFITQHFKVFTQSNTTFRDQVSNYSLSRLVSSSVHECRDNDKEIELKMVFVLSDDGKKAKKANSNNAGEALVNVFSLKNSTFSSGKSKPSSGNSRPLSGRDRPPSAKSRSDSVQSNTSRPSSGCKKKVSQKTLEKEKLEMFLSKLSDDTRKLLNLIKSAKEIEIDVLEELLDSDDININATDENGIPFLKLCVLNKHFEAIEALISAGADIDAVSGMKQTTALHEAVSLGVLGREAIEVLLEKDASTDIKDRKGKTAYDLAVDYGHDSVLNLFNKHASKGLLKDIKL